MHSIKSHVESLKWKNRIKLPKILVDKKQKQSLKYKYQHITESDIKSSRWNWQYKWVASKQVKPS